MRRKLQKNLVSCEFFFFVEKNCSTKVRKELRSQTVLKTVFQQQRSFPRKFNKRTMLLFFENKQEEKGLFSLRRIGRRSRIEEKDIACGTIVFSKEM